MKTIKIMKKLSFLLLILSLSFVSCQNDYPDLGDGVYAEFKTNNGIFVAKLYHEETPLTVANFVDLAEGNNNRVDSIYKGKKFYNGITFHRIIKDFMIQGGDPLGTGGGNPGYRFSDEFVDSLTHSKKGILSMANSGPSTNGSQFFITLKETPWLNGKHTVFGEIVLGQELVDSIGSVETSKPGDKPVDPVVINELNILRIGNVKVGSFDSEMEAIEAKNKERDDLLKEVSSEKAKEFQALKEQAVALESGLKIYYNHRSKGVKPAEGSKILMNYAGHLEDGSLFDSNRKEVAEKYNVFDHRRNDGGGYNPVETEYSQSSPLIPGFREGLLMMNVGDKVTIFIPSDLGYGERGIPNVIPPNSDLVFELEIADIVAPKE
jgi:peptidylprolyl isomerase